MTATPGSPQPSKTGTTLRWAVLLIGKNSVSPCKTPNTRDRKQASQKPITATGRFGMAADNIVGKTSCNDPMARLPA